MKKSKVITFIGGFYIFGGIISFLSLLLGGSPLNTVFDFVSAGSAQPIWVGKKHPI